MQHASRALYLFLFSKSFKLPTISRWCIFLYSDSTCKTVLNCKARQDFCQIVGRRQPLKCSRAIESVLHAGEELVKDIVKEGLADEVSGMKG